MSALTKRQVEILLGAIDTDRLEAELRLAAGWVVGPRIDSPGESPAVEVATRLGWSAMRVTDLRNGDPQAMAELAVELAERRFLD